MKPSVLALPLVLFGCASAPVEIKRLSPPLSDSKAPSTCVVVSVLHGSAAEKAGIGLGDTIASVNGQVPADAASLSDLVSAAPAESDIEVMKKGGPSQHLKIQLSATRPRLGAVCDLAGWEKPGVTAAGNESVTVFEGPYALTASGIIDKGLLFLRVRIANNGDTPIDVKPTLFSVQDSAGTSLSVMTPKEVMCSLYGEKGAHLLALKKTKKETLDSTAPGGATADERCEGVSPGHLKGYDPAYAEANADYVASESLWPSIYGPGTVADGLIYLKETAFLPITLKALLEGHTFSVQLGTPKASTRIMSHSELVKFFEAQKRGASLRLTLKKGTVMVGKFTTYDSVEERAWFDTPSSGVLRSSSHSLETIRNVEPLDPIPAKPTPTSRALN